MLEWVAQASERGAQGKGSEDLLRLVATCHAKVLEALQLEFNNQWLMACEVKPDLIAG